MKRIGIDVGGTNTDAVLIDGEKVVSAVKFPTTADVMQGVVNAIQKVTADQPASASPVDAVMIGTTHFTNAVVERARLERVGAIRIAMPAGASLPPMIDWPEDLRDAVDPLSFMVEGGHEYDGRPLVPLDVPAVREAAMKIRDAGITSVGITALFSPLTTECEDEAAEIVRSIIPDARITLSNSLGRIGLLERENVTLLNSALQNLGSVTVAAFERALKEAGIGAPFYLTQNDGTVVLAEVAAANPVYSFASGPTNSMRGAAFLTGLTEAMVIDVGGTTSDVGCLVGGFPREANNVVEVGGVRTLFRMPDLLPMALGGGTIIDPETGKIGPRSVGYRITEKALVFGGDTLTTTDIAVAAGLVEIGDRDRVRHLDKTLVATLLKRIEAMVEDGVDRMKTSAEGVKLIAVGGGAFLIPEKLKGASEVLNVEHAGVANALGAAMAQVSGEVDQVFSGLSREEALAEAETLARRRAVEAGAREGSINVLDTEDIPIAYLPGNARRVRVKVVGDISFAA
ncbi:hydantoinase/oxoprolinase family protein [Rhizobium sp. LC145]|jgi:N-methylhydantoinase A/oxoprolinase/acetone carboxylase beta subunit|uniref:hydantoinase/oxoprolinase N-terminal domain-containing protein n=1 Tax=Rhizobium sp. LC145 TaxID=1120688 RepID=UPI00062A13EE|nr:hydantoinase/oxoprolinase family protein [Rhizobium sp. LC145]KKX33108.1 hydantoinase [Rhizobium sp. LC145]TKT68731.1 hydantoinase/oxoprolinase family protein [Rhizobiaceae bacterium LC148]